MSDDFILEAPRSTDIAAVPPSSPPFHRDEHEHPVLSPDARERLCQEAWHESSQWKLSPTRRRCRNLEIKWRKVAKSIDEAMGELRRTTPDAGPLPEARRELVDNSRVVETALEDTERWLRTGRPLCHIEAEGEQDSQVPRAYAAAAAFLRATGFTFEEQALGIYFRAAQEQAALEVDELWALRPVMQLVVLEQIGFRMKRPTTEVGHSSPDLQVSPPKVD